MPRQIPTRGGPGAGLLRRMNNLKAHLPNYWCSLRLKRNQWCAGCARALGARGVPGVSLVLENLPGQNFPGQPGSDPGQDRRVREGERGCEGLAEATK